MITSESSWFANLFALFHRCMVRPFTFVEIHHYVSLGFSTMVWIKEKAVLGTKFRNITFSHANLLPCKSEVQPPRKEDVGFKMLLLQSREKSFLSVAGILITQWTISFTVIFNFILISRKHQYSTSPLILVYSIQSYSRVQRCHKMMFVSII